LASLSLLSLEAEDLEDAKKAFKAAFLRSLAI
jgi:hypothetical protein